MRPYVHDVPPLLENGLRVLIYAGDADFVCNWMGNKAWTLNLPWSGHDEFNQADDEDWITESGVKAGELRTTEDRRLVSCVCMKQAIWRPTISLSVDLHCEPLDSRYSQIKSLLRPPKFSFLT